MTLAHDLAGSGPTVVLLHSSVCDRRMWDPQWELLLGAGYQVLRADFRGHGETPAPTGSYSNAEDVRDLLDELGLTEIKLIGSSFGGRVAQEFAARWPERVSTLGLICAANRLHPPTDAIKAFGAKEDELLEAGDVDAAVQLNVDTFVGPKASAQTRAKVAQMQRRAFDVQLAMTGDPESRNADFDLAAITARTTVVKGALDVDYFQSTADMLAAAIPHAELVDLPWAGHLPSLEDPAEFNPVLLRLLG